MTVEPQAPKVWRGRFYEDFDVGDVFASRLGRTVTETDNVWFTCLTMNTNQMHFNAPFAARTEFAQPLVVSSLTLAIVLGLSVADTSENAVANLGWGDIKLPKPVFAGDTIWAESEVMSVRESKSRPSCGIVGIRTRGVNQRGEVVIEFTRSFMIFKRDAAEVADTFPVIDADWTVGS
jgi:itaconyl-CoA hydratase